MARPGESSSLASLTLGALGVVYGDIGTSPLYAIKEIFSESTGVPLNPQTLVGAVSAVFWALMLVVTLKYVALILRADNRGEGGIMALLSLASSAMHNPKIQVGMVLLGAFGASLFYGDSILTPAISVLSAIEGLEVATPQFQAWVLPLSTGVLLALFAMQRYGTSVVGSFFGPVIVIWFGVLAVIGVCRITEAPQILWALDPRQAIRFFAERGPGILLAAGAVVLAITGAEALYADMGHFGKRAIRTAWLGLVFPALALNYLGQGALLLNHPAALENPFYRMFPDWLLLPAVGLATLATIIASQATISGAYSMTQQAIQLGLLPRMRIIHTSARERGQIYIPVVNGILLVAVITTMIAFGSSSALASAYGTAVTLTMLATTILAYFVVRHVWKRPLWLALGATGAFLLLDGFMVAACSAKFLHGGWLPVALGLGLLLVMTTWKKGRSLLISQIREHDPDLMTFIRSITRTDLPVVDRTAVYLVADPSTAPQALMHNLKHNMILHRQNLILTVRFEEQPWVPDAERIMIEPVHPGFWCVQVRYGYMNQPDIPQALLQAKAAGLDINLFTTSFFLSRETVVPTTGGGMSRWREELFASLSRNAGSVVGYFNIPSNSVIELGTRVHI